VLLGAVFALLILIAPHTINTMNSIETTNDTKTYNKNLEDIEAKKDP
jgi:hypothetical protein